MIDAGVTETATAVGDCCCPFFLCFCIVFGFGGLSLEGYRSFCERGRAR